MRPLGVLLAVVLLLAGCGREEPTTVAMAAVPDGLVPRSVLDGGFVFRESDRPVTETFAEAGPHSLAADGRLWELRTGDRLLAVLQLTTLLPEVDLQDQHLRTSVVEQLLPVGRDRFDRGDVAVWSAERAGKTAFLWFGQGLFCLLTIKPGSRDTFEPEAVLDGVLDHMVAAPGWEYVYIDDEDDEGEPES